MARAGPPKKKKMTQAEQSASFIETARKLETDERPEEFERVLKKVARKRKQSSHSHS
jgi:hypothetical protein